LQKVLVVSEDVDLMGGLRELLGRVKCSTAGAFDGRQTFDLVPMVKPEVILVDLSLPRGDALRVLARLRSDPKMVHLSLGIPWTSALDSAEFAQHAARDYPLPPHEIRRALARHLGAEEAKPVAEEVSLKAG
jgi:CheY-like chemotaxis protein